MLPDAGAHHPSQADIQQSIRDLWRSIDDRSRAIDLIDSILAHHAPELYSWAEKLVGRKLPRQAEFARESFEDAAKRQYEAIFGVELTLAAEEVAPETPTLEFVSTAFESSEPTETTVLIDPELARLALALDYGTVFRVWSIGRQLTREGDGSGKITRKALREALGRFGARLSDRHLRRLYKEADGVFWNVDGERIFLRGWQYVAVRLVDEALATNPDMVARNKPGVRQIEIDPGGRKEQFDAQVYGAWLTHRENPTIARDTLSMLFGRDADTIRRWEKVLGGRIEKRANYVQCPDWQHFFDHLPPHTRGYAARVRFDGALTVVSRARWQMSNTYDAKGFTQRRKGQASKVRGAVNKRMDMPADDRRGGSHLMYVEDSKTVRRIGRKRPDALPLFVWRGENKHGHGIFEINDNGFVQTYANERLSFALEQSWYAEQKRQHEKGGQQARTNLRCTSGEDQKNEKFDQKGVDCS